MSAQITPLYWAPVPIVAHGPFIPWDQWTSQPKGSHEWDQVNIFSFCLRQQLFTTSSTQIVIDLQREIGRLRYSLAVRQDQYQVWEHTT